MKIQYPISILALLFLFDSCQKCELIDQTIDNPSPACAGIFYFNKTQSPFSDFNFFFNEFDKPIPEPFEYAQGPGPNLVPTAGDLIASNFSAFDSINGQYIFEYRYFDGSTPMIRFHHHDVETFTSTFSSPMSNFSSPVFINTELYAITAGQDNQFAFYEIVELNPLTGQVISVLTSGNFAANSPFDSHYMSSVSNGDDLIYFLSGTNLIEARVSTLTSRHIDIDPTYNVNDNPVIYYGLEYASSKNSLLAMVKLQDGVGAPITDLVTIDISIKPAIITSNFNIAASLPKGQDDQINPEFYSTTFDQCDNTYYITEIQPVSGNITTNLHEINLDKMEFKTQQIQDYMYGLELNSKK